MTDENGRLGDISSRLVDTAGVNGEKLDVAFGKWSRLYGMVYRNIRIHHYINGFVNFSCSGKRG